MHGEVYSLPRWIGVKTKEVRARVGDGNDLPDVMMTKIRIARDMKPIVLRMKGDMLAELMSCNMASRDERKKITVRHREVRRLLDEKIERRRWEEARERQARFRTGLKGLWDWVSGENGRIRARNEEEAKAAARRERAEIDALIFAQLEEKRRMIDLRREITREYAARSRDIRGDLRAYDMLAGPSARTASHRKRRRPDG